MTKLLIHTDDIENFVAQVEGRSHGRIISYGNKSDYAVLTYTGDVALTLSDVPNQDCNFLDTDHQGPTTFTREMQTIDVMVKGKKYPVQKKVTVAHVPDAVQSPAIADVRDMTDQEIDDIMAWPGF